MCNDGYPTPHLSTIPRSPSTCEPNGTAAPIRSYKNTNRLAIGPPNVNAHNAPIVGKKDALFISDELMGHIPFSWLPMGSTTATAIANTGAHPPPLPAVATNNSVVHHRDQMMSASRVPPTRQSMIPGATVVARRHQEEEYACIRLVHRLLTCAGAIQAGDYSVALGNLSEARRILKAIPTSTGIGRLGSHFADALAQRLFPAHPNAAAPPPPPATPIDLYNHFYDAGPYLKFAYSTANRAILEAFKGYRYVHVIDFTLLQGHQWPALMRALATREGGPPELCITCIVPNLPEDDRREDLAVVCHRLTEVARYLKIPFTFQGVRANRLGGLWDWVHLKTIYGEALAINSVLQLHELLEDPEADGPAVPASIDMLLELVVKLKPRIFTVVEQEEDHNRPVLPERFANALFHYGAMFDSLEAMSKIGGGDRSNTNTPSISTLRGAEAYLRAEILDVVCGEGGERMERHELLGRWRERLAHAGLVQVPFSRTDQCLATADLIGATSFSGSGFSIQERDGSLLLAWHGRPLYAATTWRAAPGAAAANHTSVEFDVGYYYHKGKGRIRSSGGGGDGGGSSNGRRGGGGGAGGITML